VCAAPEESEAVGVGAKPTGEELKGTLESMPICWRLLRPQAKTRPGEVPFSDDASVCLAAKLQTRMPTAKKIKNRTR
jgi:hypothetical protein